MSNIREMYASLLATDPSSMTEGGLAEYQDSLQSKYRAFTQAVWESVPHADDEEMPDVPLPSDGQVSKRAGAQLAEDIKRTNRLLMGMQIDRKLHGLKDAELSGALNLADADALNNAMRECGIRKNKEGQWEFINQDCRSAAIDLCLAYAERMTAFTQAVNDVVAKGEAVTQDSLTIGEPINVVFNNVPFSQDFLCQLFDKLVRLRWIEGKEDRDTFMFIFGGIGAPPCVKLRWRTSALRLAYFIKTISEDSRQWKKIGSTITIWNHRCHAYRDINVVSLKSSYCASYRATYSENSKDNYSEDISLLFDLKRGWEPRRKGVDYT